MTDRKIELLAPVGSFESLMAAIQAGADAIYFGTEHLNMRARSSINFSLNDLKKIVNTCKENKLKAYLTLNTVIYEHDMRIMREIVDAAKENGVDAVIACDFAVLEYAKSVDMPVHISTQANVSNLAAVEFYSKYADLIVLARELSLKQVEYICSEIKKRNIKGVSGDTLKIEIFVHGALCMAISGKCYLSLHSNNASANRGACVQNCRRSYIVKDEDDNELSIENEYIMSAKDLCTIDFLDKILDTGVSVLKIEGRGRSADYVYTVVKCYKEAIEAYFSNNYNKEKIMLWKKRLSTVFNRGFWDGYYLGRRIGEWSNEYGSLATQRKIYIGRGVKYFKKINVGEFYIETHSLKVGDKILITGPTTGVVYETVKNIRKENKDVKIVYKGDRITIPVNTVIRSSDKLYKLVDV